jgi:hypothetical protein
MSMDFGLFWAIAISEIFFWITKKGAKHIHYMAEDPYIWEFSGSDGRPCCH